MDKTPPTHDPRLHERRLNMRLMAQWQERRGDRSFASYSDIDLALIDDIWPDCFVVVAGDREPVFHHVGPAIAADSGIGVGQPAIFPPPHQTLLGCALRPLATVFSQKIVVSDGGVFHDTGQTAYLYRSILLPLSDDQETINYVIGGARCKPLASAGRDGEPGGAVAGEPRQ